MEQNLENLNTLLNTLEKGEFLEGMEKFFHDGVVIQEVGQQPKRGKETCIAAETDLLSTVAEFIQYTAQSKGAGEDRTFYEAVMVFKTTGDEHIRLKAC